MISPCDTCGNRMDESFDPNGCWRGYGTTGILGRLSAKLFGCEGYKKLHEKPAGAETAEGSHIKISDERRFNRTSTSTKKRQNTSAGTPPGSRPPVNNKNPSVTANSDRFPTFWILTGLIIFGAALRFLNLGTNSVWLDEAATSFFSTQGILKIWESTVAGEFNPPLFYVLEHFMIGVFGNTELILRILPAVFGVMAIPVFYLVGKEFKDRNTGIIIAVMCTVSPFLIWYSQEARAYTLLLLLIAGATYYFLRALRTNGYRDWVLFAVFGAVAFWVHFYAMVVMVAFLSYTLISLIESDRKSRIKPFLISVCIYILIIFPLLVSMGGLVAKRTASAPTYGIQGIELARTTFQQLSGFSEIILFLFFTLFCLGTVWMFLKERGKGTFLIWVTIMVFVASVFASGIIPMLPRYLIFISIFYYLGIAVSYECIQNITGWNTHHLVTAFCIVLVLVSIPFLSGYYSQPTKDDWRQVSEDLEQITEPGDTVVTVPTYIDLPLGYYYSSVNDGTDMQGAMTAYGLELVRAKSNGTVWYVISSDIMAADPSGSSLNWLHENTETVGHYRGDVYILKGI